MIISPWAVLGNPLSIRRFDRSSKGSQTISVLPVAVITNGSLLYEQEVREDLLRADVVLPSLDAVSPEVFEKINRPGPGFSIERVVEGLIQFRKIYQGQIWLEILFCRGVNDTESELLRMKEAIKQIRPDQIHLNTVVRPPSEKWVAPLTPDEMEKIRAFFGERASIISEFDRHILPPPETEMTEKILSILRRRPLSLSDLSQNMGLSQNELETLPETIGGRGKGSNPVPSGFCLLRGRSELIFSVFANQIR